MIYRFGAFELDDARFELRHRGTAAEVQPKVLRLLLHLVQHRERAVGVDELLRELWPDEVVGQGSVKRAVRGARSVLMSFGGEEAWIRTVPRYGYQFVAEVSVNGAEAARPLAPAQPVREGLLGREGVMALLEESLQQALAGTSGCVLIAGSPGLGKTRTIETLLAHAHALGADAWAGRCTEIEGAPAFWPFIQVFREALRDRGAERLRALLGSEGADIAGAIGELREQLPDLPVAPPLASASARFRLFDSFSVFLRRAADERPVVLALDDLHCADPASLRLLLFALRQVQRARLLIVGAFRAELSHAPETSQLLGELTREAGARCITLQGLSRGDIAQYVEQATGMRPPASVSELLHEQTAGNPLFVHHLIENWRASGDSQGAPAWQSLTRPPVSQGLAGAIEQHLRLVSAECRELLRVAAVLGTDFSVGVVAHVASLPLPECNARLSEAVASGLVRERAGELAGYRFAHVLVRDALYLQLTAAERGPLHCAAARALEAQGVGEDVVLLAEVTRHYVLAAPTYDGGRALSYTLRAAETALRTLAYEQAAAGFERALELLQCQGPDPRRRMSLLFRKGDALARVDLAAARKVLFEVAALAHELGEADVLVRAAALIASRPESGSVDAAQLELLRQALAALPANAADEPRRVLVQALIAKSLLYATDTRERVSLALAALQRAPELSDPSLRAEVLTRCHEALPGPDHLRDRLAITRELMSLAHRSGEPVALLQAFAAHMETSVERGDMQAVDSALDSMDALAERVREPFYRWYGKVMRAMRAYVQGDLERSAERVHEAWQSRAPITPELARHVYCIQTYPVLHMRGQLREAEPLAREMMLYYPTLVGWHAAWGSLVWSLGQHDNARRCLERLMMQGAASLRSESTVLASLAALGDLCCKLRDVAAAKQIYATLLPYAEHHGCTNLGASTYGPTSRVLGMLAECQGDAERAEAHYRAALDSADRMRSPVYSSSISVLYARLLLRGGAPNERHHAAVLLSRAFQLADRSQLPSLHFVCRGLADHHGIDLAQPPAAPLLD
jgi:DNA-binding winged helix-turn-helix (wHTH) protein/tetratricopeptide (TPR) repeat protein